MRDCVFCAITRDEIDSRRVREDDHFVAFHDVDPKADTHVLVVPREHFRDLDEFASSAGDGTAALRFAAETARELGVAGRYRLITNIGSEAGQSVQHLHWHVMAGDDLPGFH